MRTMTDVLDEQAAITAEEVTSLDTELEAQLRKRELMLLKVDELREAILSESDYTIERIRHRLALLRGAPKAEEPAETPAPDPEPTVEGHAAEIVGLERKAA